MRQRLLARFGVVLALGYPAMAEEIEQRNRREVFRVGQAEGGRTMPREAGGSLEVSDKPFLSLRSVCRTSQSGVDARALYLMKKSPTGIPSDRANYFHLQSNCHFSAMPQRAGTPLQRAGTPIQPDVTIRPVLAKASYSSDLRWREGGAPGGI